MRRPAAGGTGAASATSVLIVTIDTLRADRLGVYGATNVATPNIDALAREGAWAPQATVHAPLTRPSHASLFTGRSRRTRHPRQRRPPLAPDVPLLSERFKREGFATGAFIASAVLDRQSGLDRGFDRYSDRFDAGADRKPGDVVVAEAIEWMKGSQRGLRLGAPLRSACPVLPPGRYAAEYAGRPYDGTVAWSDELVGRLVSALREAGRSTARCSSSRRITARRWANTARTCTAISSTRPRCACRSSSAGPASSRARASRAWRAPSTCSRRLSRWRARRRATGHVRPKPRAALARGHDRRRAVVRRVARAASALRMERPARRARRTLEVHPRAETRALRPGPRSGRAAQPGGRRAGARARAARQPRGAAEGGADLGAYRTRRRPASRRRCSSALARWATSGPGGLAEPRKSAAASRSEGQARRLQGAERADAAGARGAPLRPPGRRRGAAPGGGATRRRQLRDPLLPRARLRWARAMAGGGGRIRAGHGEAAGRRRGVARTGREPRRAARRRGRRAGVREARVARARATRSRSCSSARPTATSRGTRTPARHPRGAGARSEAGAVPGIRWGRSSARADRWRRRNGRSAEATTREPDNGLYAYNRGLALQQLGRRDEALAS